MRAEHGAKKVPLDDQPYSVLHRREGEERPYGKDAADHCPCRHWDDKEEQELGRGEHGREEGCRHKSAGSASCDIDMPRTDGRARTHARVDGARSTFAARHLVAPRASPEDGRHGGNDTADEVEAEKAHITQ